MSCCGGSTVGDLRREAVESGLADPLIPDLERLQARCGEAIEVLRTRDHARFDAIRQLEQEVLGMAAQIMLAQMIVDPMTGAQREAFVRQRIPRRH